MANSSSAANVISQALLSDMERVKGKIVYKDPTTGMKVTITFKDKKKNSWRFPFVKKKETHPYQPMFYALGPPEDANTSLDHVSEDTSSTDGDDYNTDAQKNYEGLKRNSRRANSYENIVVPPVPPRCRLPLPAPRKSPTKPTSVSSSEEILYEVL